MPTTGSGPRNSCAERPPKRFNPMDPRGFGPRIRFPAGACRRTCALGFRRPDSVGADEESNVCRMTWFYAVVQNPFVNLAWFGPAPSGCPAVSKALILAARCSGQYLLSGVSTTPVCPARPSDFRPIFLANGSQKGPKWPKVPKFQGKTAAFSRLSPRLRSESKWFRSTFTVSQWRRG
jgi:hypothetical protein